MSTTQQWVALLISVFTVNGIGGLWFVERMRRRTTQTDQKITDTGQALGGFRDLVSDLQEERADLRTERDALKKRIVDLEAQVSDLIAVAEKRHRDNDKGHQ